VLANEDEMGFFTKREPAIDTSVVYSPKEDITTYELAQVVSIVITSVRWGRFFDIRAYISSLPENVQRHFKERAT
jgi:hypothetical protein